MKIGVKYCGGCNSTYRRESVEEMIREVFGNKNVVYALRCEDVDVLILICGCKTACASREVNCKNLVVIDEPKSKDELREIVKSSLKS